MFVAYLVPREDHHLVVEDGLGYIEIGATEEEAKAKVLAKREEDFAEQNARAVALGYEAEAIWPWEDEYALHCNEV